MKAKTTKGYSQDYIYREVKRVIKLMNYFDKRICRRFNEVQFDTYQTLGNYWGMLAQYCKHQYRLSKKFPLGRCKFCGTILTTKD